MLGAVLVGGLSRRMGTDKAWIDWRGRPLALHVAERLREACGQVVLVGGSGRGYERLGLPWWPDLPGIEGVGPMAGLITALGLAPAVFLAACDLPELDPWIVRSLIAAAGTAPVAMPVISGRIEPLLGVYRRPAARAAWASIAAGSGRMTDLLSTPGALLLAGERLGSPEAVAGSFRNLNSPFDLAR